MTKLRLAAIMLAALTIPAIAQTPPPGAAPGFQSSPLPSTVPPIAAPSSVTTSRGGGLVTGSPGSPRMIMIPGSAVPGMLLDNGNGTSTIMVPGSPSEVVPNSR